MRPSDSFELLEKYSREISLRGRKPWRLPPSYSTKAASRLGSTRVILPLYMLDFFCSRLRFSISRSYSHWPSTRATRNSSGCVAFMSILFMCYLIVKFERTGDEITKANTGILCNRIDCRATSRSRQRLVGRDSVGCLINGQVAAADIS